MLNLQKYFPLSVAFLVGVILTQAISYIHAQEGNLIHGCVRPAGLLRIIDENETCNPNETPLTWNIQGPAGPAGPMGPTGATGSQGSNNVAPFLYCTRCDINGDTAGNRFVNLNLTNALWSETSFTDINFQGVNLTSANLNASGFGRVDFTNATLVNTDFSDRPYGSSAFNEVNFTNANLLGANFSGVTEMNNITWSNTTCPDGTNSDNNGNTCEGHLTP